MKYSKKKVQLLTSLHFASFTCLPDWKLYFLHHTNTFLYEPSEQDWKHLITYQPVVEGEKSQEGAV